MFWQTAYANTVGLPQASTYAHRVDGLHDFLWYLSFFFLALVTIAMLVFVYKYHRGRKGRKTAYILGSHLLESIWTIVPLILMLAIFAWGYKDFLVYRTEPLNPVEVNFIGRQWSWTSEYNNGRKVMNELYVPKGRAVKLIITSEDVLHSVYLPHMRIKQDAVPGRYTYMSFEPTEVGVHPLYCAEYCGTSHSDMLARVYVLEQKDFDSWLETGKVPAAAMAQLKANDHTVNMFATERSGGSVASGTSKTDGPAAKGRQVMMAKGCFACHSDDGTRKIGPSLKAVYGTMVELEGGRTVKADENYLRKSLEEPMADVVKGFPPSMPTFKGLLSDEEISAVIAYMKSIK